MAYRVPMKFTVSKPFTANGKRMETGTVLTAEECRGLKLGALVSGRYLVPTPDPYSRRGAHIHGGAPTTVPGDAYPHNNPEYEGPVAETAPEAEPEHQPEPEPEPEPQQAKRRSRKAADTVEQGQDGPAS